MSKKKSKVEKVLSKKHSFKQPIYKVNSENISNGKEPVVTQVFEKHISKEIRQILILIIVMTLGILALAYLAYQTNVINELIKNLNVKY